jgi:hypothetical protein
MTFELDVPRLYRTGPDCAGNEHDDVGTSGDAAQLQQLRADGVHFVEPDAGEMACGTYWSRTTERA